MSQSVHTGINRDCSTTSVQYFKPYQMHLTRNQVEFTNFLRTFILFYLDFGQYSRRELLLPVCFYRLLER